MFDSAESLQRIGECSVGNKSPREKFVVRLNFLICSFMWVKKHWKIHLICKHLLNCSIKIVIFNNDYDFKL